MANVGLTVHRATREIGGNCLELSTAEGHRIILDVGRPLDAPQEARRLLPKSLDHYGLLEDVPANWPIYSRAASERLIKLSSTRFGKKLPHAFTSWTSGAAIEVGPFAVTPLLTDHSLFDAHMLVIEMHGKRILYSGDFRTHGRKAALPRPLMAAPPENLDVLLMEGTNSAAISRV